LSPEWTSGRFLGKYISEVTTADMLKEPTDRFLEIASGLRFGF
jgi:hypothetical protein